MATPDHLYIIQQRGSRLFKFGVSKNPKRRLQTLQTGNPQQLSLLVSFPCVGISAYAAEATIHRYLGSEHVKGEWFQIATDDRVVELAATIKKAVTADQHQNQSSRFELPPDAPTTPPCRSSGSRADSLSTPNTRTTFPQSK